MTRIESATTPFAVALLLGALATTPTHAQPSRSTPPQRPASRVEVHEASIQQLQQAMADGRTTSAQLVDAYLARITAYETAGPALNAMIRLNPRARADAVRLDGERRNGRVRGPLHGIPIILKDNFDTADLPTSGGSIALAGNVPATDAFVVSKLRDAGAVIIGKSNLHELAAGIITISSLGGQTRNPYDPRRYPGGSSGGTGAAIAASFATVGWGSDTCGSIRIPCAFNNLVGLRPTQGMVSGRGIIPLSHTQDIGGPLARTVTDLAIALDATVGPDSADPGTRVLAGRAVPRFTDSLTAGALRGARIGILMNYMTDTDGEIADTIRAATRAMRDGGAEIVEVNVPGFDGLMVNSAVIAHEFKFDLMDYLAARPGAGIASLREILDRGLYHDALRETFERRDAVAERMTPAYRGALEKRGVIRDRMVQLMDSLRLDALVYPSVRRKPAFIGDPQLGGNCALSAQSGLPAISVPAGFSVDGLPIGLEMLGRPWADARLVALAYAFEQRGSRRRPPPTTPALVNGRAPSPVKFTAVARGARGRAPVTFAFDATRSELAYTVRVVGIPPTQVAGVVLMRTGPASTATDTTRTSVLPARAATGPTRPTPNASPASHVVHRLSGPERVLDSGTVFLDGANLRALHEGRLELGLVSTDGVTARAPMRVPRSTAQPPAPGADSNRQVPQPQPTSVARARVAGTGMLLGRITDTLGKALDLSILSLAPVDRPTAMLKGANTDSQGRFMLENIPAGSYTGTARRIGYHPFSWPQVIRADVADSVTIVLRNNPLRLEDVCAGGDYGLKLEVIDGRTGAPLREGVVAIAREGLFVDTLASHSVGATEVLAGAFVRPGTYDVTVTKPGYREWTATRIEVTQNGCEFTSPRLQARLEPVR